ncbi:unnamed protein product [Polarella glacialis]|uniref:Helicase C-terminal domain-containing protein n=1 Tax=Polarella glacialis TaxID=89957 RepID=A0A813ELZ1_POLGL|nr:unnamed protein product [Polarella glacialis]
MQKQLWSAKSVALTRKVFSATASAKAVPVADYICSLLAASEQKLVAFAYHTSMLDVLEARLTQALVSFVRVDCSTAADVRSHCIAQFQGEMRGGGADEVRVALMSLTACSQGISLTAACTVVCAELFWTPAQLLQAEDRVHRPGQQQEVDVHYCVADGSAGAMDKRFIKMLERKTGMIEQVVEGSRLSRPGAFTLQSDRQ